MSKLAKKPIIIPSEVEVKLSDNKLEFSGKEGKLTVPILPFTNVAVKDGQINVSLSRDIKQGKANVGTLASLIKNAVIGVAHGFSKTMQLDGIGFKASMEGLNLTLNVGYTLPIKFTPPATVKISVDKNLIKVSGVSKELVGQISAKIRKIYPPEPYKGKGIHYVGEIVRRKAGKKVAGTGAAAA